MSIRERHRPVRQWRHSPDDEPKAVDVCEHDRLVWPCEVIIEVDRADAAEQRLADDIIANGTIAAMRALERDAAEADAERLAEALRKWLQNDRIRPFAEYSREEARDALAAHDERVRR